MMRAATFVSFALILTLASGFKLKTVSNGQCVKDYHQGAQTSQYVVVDCSNPRFATAQFSWQKSQNQGEQRLATVYGLMGSKCLYVNNDDFKSEPEYYVSSQDCNDSKIQNYLSWDAEDAGNNAVRIRHVRSGLCLKPEDNPSDANQAYLAAANCTTTNVKMLFRVEN